MTTFPGSPRILKGGIVLLDPDTFNVLPNGIIVLQHNPESPARTVHLNTRGPLEIKIQLEDPDSGVQKTYDDVIQVEAGMPSGEI